MRPVDVRDTSFQFEGRAIPARVYTPRGVISAPAIMVVHGMHQLGIEEPRLVGFARSLAASGFLVVTPLVPGIADYRVEGTSAELIGTAAQAFAHELQVPRVGVLALSFSGGLALLAAADPRYAPSIAWVATVGAHYDLAHVMEFFATGNAPLPDGRVEHFQPHEYGPLIVIYDEPQDFFAPQDAATAREALKLLLGGNGKVSEALTAKMTAADQQTMQHIYHHHREALAPAILAEIQKQRQKLAEASPAGHLASLQIPVMLLHGSDDTVIPPTELAWLQREIPKDKVRAALVSPAISHVEVGSKASLLDRLALVHWMAEMLALARATGESGDSSHLPAGLWLATSGAAQ